MGAQVSKGYRKKFPKGKNWEEPKPNPLAENDVRISVGAHHGVKVVGYTKEKVEELMKSKSCCNEEILHEDGSLEIKTPYPKSGEYNLLHKRNHFELWLDKYNHTLELVRTVVQVLVLVMQFVILIKLFK